MGGMSGGGGGSNPFGPTVDLSEMQTIADQCIVGNNSGDVSVPLQLTVADVKTLLALGTAADNDTGDFDAAGSAAAAQSAAQAYADGIVVGLFDDKGNIDCSTNPNYPAASQGDVYTVSVAGKIGGASGITVDVGDVVRALADNAGGTQAAVGASWAIVQANLVGALVSGGALGTPSSGTLTNCTGYTEANLSTSDITTNDVSASKHGFVPKAPNDTTKFLRGDGAWAVPASGLTETPAKSASYTVAAGECVVLDTNAATHSDTFTAVAATDVVTFTSYTPSDGDEFELTTSGSLPGGLSANTRYYAINSSGSTCKFSTSLGGSAVDITSTGSGTHTASRTAFPIIFPSSPSDGDCVGLWLPTSHAVTTVIVNRNGKTLDSGTVWETFRLVQSGDFLKWVYNSSLGDWRCETRKLKRLYGIAERNTAQTLTNGTDVKIQINSDVSSAPGVTDVTTNYQMTIRRTGYYHVVASGDSVSLTIGTFRSNQIYVNGTIKRSAIAFNTTTDYFANRAPIVSEPLLLVAGDKVALYMKQSSSADQNTNTNAERTPRLAIMEIL